jgi:hypothetical protein
VKTGKGLYEPPWQYAWALPLSPWLGDLLSMHGARGGAPEGTRNGNYRHGGRTKEMIEVWKLIKSLR